MDIKSILLSLILIISGITLFSQGTPTITFLEPSEPSGTNLYCEDEGVEISVKFNKANLSSWSYAYKRIDVTNENGTIPGYSYDQDEIESFIEDDNAKGTVTVTASGQLTNNDDSIFNFSTQVYIYSRSNGQPNPIQGPTLICNGETKLYKVADWSGCFDPYDNSWVEWDVPSGWTISSSNFSGGYFNAYISSPSTGTSNGTIKFRGNNGYSTTEWNYITTYLGNANPSLISIGVYQGQGGDYELCELNSNNLVAASATERVQKGIYEYEWDVSPTSVIEGYWDDIIIIGMENDGVQIKTQIATQVI